MHNGGIKSSSIVFVHRALTLWMQFRRYPGSEADLFKSERTETSI